MLLLVSFVSGLACVFAGGYMRHGSTRQPACGGFTATTICSSFALLAVPAFAIRILLWVGSGVGHAVFSVLLVGFDSTPSALEAAWKLAILTIMGAPIALFGFLTLYWAFRAAAGGAAETWQSSPGDGIHDVAEPVEAFFFAGLCRIWRQDRSCADAHLAAGCT